MHLTHDQIATIAKWEPIQEGFGREDPQTEKRIREIGDQIRLSGDFGCKILGDDGMSNYFISFAFVLDDVLSNPERIELDGHLIYYSACGPVCVAGRARTHSEPNVFYYDHLTIDKVLDPNRPQGALEQKTFEAIRAGGYELLSAENVSEPLPPGVVPDEYCLVPEPWDRVFHALFADTD